MEPAGRSSFCREWPGTRLPDGTPQLGGGDGGKGGGGSAAKRPTRKERSTDLPSGVITIGARVYVPSSGAPTTDRPPPGRLLQPVRLQLPRPVNRVDLDGRFSIYTGHWSVEEARNIALFMDVLAEGTQDAPIPPVLGTPS